MFSSNLKKISIFAMAAAVVFGCSPRESRKDPTANKNVQIQTVKLIASDYAPGEITRLCEGAIQKLDQVLEGIVKLPAEERNFENTVLKMETAFSDASDLITPLTFMGYVSKDEALRAEGSECEELNGQFYVAVLARKDLYEVIKDIQSENKEEKRLIETTKQGFLKNGLQLSDDKLEELKKLKQQLASLESKFSQNLNNDVSTVAFSAEELKGVSEGFIQRLKKNDQGQILVTTKSSDYLQVVENAINPETRKKIYLAYNNRAGEANTQLLTQAVSLRQQIAKILGYKTWADYRIDGRMAKDSKTVLEFLNGLKEKLSLRNKADLDLLLKYKKEIDPRADHLDPWDISFCSYQIKKRDFNLDDEKIREYFPSSVVMKGLFDVYSKLLDVKYVEVGQVGIWSSDVKLYEIREASNNNLLAYFYADFIPRPGKYGHAAAFPLILGRKLADGSYSLPVSAIVANFTPAEGDKPSLMNHEEVETVFHEFGHIMHQTLTRAPYGSLAGSAVAQDFVEAPSQMLENWPWDKEILKSLSGHYKNNEEKLPADLLEQMLKAKDFNQGYFYTRQLMLGLFDMAIHTSQSEAPVNVDQVYNQIFEDVIGLKSPAEAHFAATFGHLMGGYDAGYYGYMWSDVYAADMFTRFQAQGLLSSSVGGDYRKIILESGSMEEALDLLKKFLGREPTLKLFIKNLGFKKIGIKKK